MVKENAGHKAQETSNTVSQQAFPVSTYYVLGKGDNCAALLESSGVYGW